MFYINNTWSKYFNGRKQIKILVLFLAMENLKMCLNKQTKPSIQCQQGILTTMSPTAESHREKIASKYNLIPLTLLCFVMRSYYAVKETMLLLLLM